MSQIILGTVQFGIEYGINNKNGRPSRDRVFEILEQAYESGIRTLDTADAYGDAVDLIGSFHRHTGKRFEVNTKFSESTPSALAGKLEASLLRLSVERVETYFYHSFTQYNSEPLLKEALQKLKEQKQIAKTGLSVYTPHEMQTAIDDDAIDVIQFPFNLFDNGYQRGVLIDKAKKRNKELQVRSVFLQGLFFKDIATLPGYLLPLQPYLEAVRSVALRAGITMEELCLQYAAAQTGVDGIIIGVDTRAQLLRNLQSLDAKLDETVSAEINRIQVEDTTLLYPYNWK